MESSPPSPSSKPAPETTSGRPHNYRPPSVEDSPEDLPPHAAPSPPRKHAQPSASTTATDDDLQRTCRICLEPTPPPYAPSPELGRLLSPCTCRGSSRYVHSVCLQLWRATSSKAYYQCPTCHYRYRFQRLSVASLLSSTTTTFLATFTILLALVWALGFVAEPILATYLLDVPQDLDLPVAHGGWAEHFLRGLASLGLLGFLKVVYLIGPGSWWSIRNSGVLGRNRVSRLSWLVVAIGIANFFVWLWRRVGGAVRERMQRAAVEVLDVGEEGDGEVQPEGAAPWGTWAVGGMVGAWTRVGGLGRWLTGRGAL